LIVLFIIAKKLTTSRRRIWRWCAYSTYTPL